MQRPGETRQIAQEVLAAFDAHRSISTFSSRDPAFDLTQSYAVTTALRDLRHSRGEQQVGRKIGFTNRQMWSEYGVYAPIWGDMYAHTVRPVEKDESVSIGHLVEPRIEPELAFRLQAAPSPDMNDRELLACIGAMAHGFEIVQSIFPAWRFTAPDCIAGGGLHGLFLMGPEHTLDSGTDWPRMLETFAVELRRGSEVVDKGAAANVLGGPLHALRHLVELLAADPEQPPLRAGEIITTGTLTRAFPIEAGQQWSTAITGLPLPGLSITFV